MQVTTVIGQSGSRARKVTANLALAFVAEILISLLVSSAQAQTFRVVYAFTGGSDGSLAQPFADLVQDASGNLYGTTSGFSCLNGCSNAPGAVFKLSTSGNETTLHTFDCAAEGCSPLSGLVADNAGNVYGTTQTGNTVWGTVYKLNATNETVLHSFTGSDGKLPQARLLRDSSGNLYGTAPLGGDLNCNPKGGCGVVFEISNAGEFKLLHSFTGGEDGDSPFGGLVIDAQGNLYGTTQNGGGSGCTQSLGCGTVFKISTSGQETVLYRFVGSTDGSGPQGDLFLDRTGNLYGTTAGGGGSGCQGSGCGTVFKIEKNGLETVLYRFAGGNDGSTPVAGLVADSAGNLYGTTLSGGGKSNGGTVFRLTPSGEELILHRFSGGTDGANPEAKLLLGLRGTLYGTTRSGGNSQCAYGTGFVSGCGVVFAISK
jgi:uncharacterized repeat protein (TIGR03803 family)